MDSFPSRASKRRHFVDVIGSIMADDSVFCRFVICMVPGIFTSGISLSFAPRRASRCMGSLMVTELSECTGKCTSSYCVMCKEVMLY